MGGDTGRRVLGIGSAAAVMLAAVLVVGPVLVPGEEPPRHPQVVRPEPQPPIVAEADVFRTEPAALAVPPAEERPRPGRARTLASYRSLRAYPGAPPRIPHELTADEFRLARCGTCHARGGWSERFGAYAPVTPHPELTSCLQCHVTDGPAPDFVALDWVAAAWPEVDGRALEGSPPWIPHGFEMRADCLACHGGPAAVAEVRTTHPERANCRQCHVPASSEDASAGEVFTRPLDRGPGPGGDR